MPNGKKYFAVIEDNEIKYMRDDNNKYVYRYNISDSNEYRLYDFFSEDRTIWLNPFGFNYYGISITEQKINYFHNKNSFYKVFEWVKIDSASTPPDTIWSPIVDVWATEITQGIGITNHQYPLISGGLYAAIINGDTLGTLTNVKDDKDKNSDFQLFQNYPNPFNPETVISFRLSVFSHATLKIFDVLGNEIATLVNEEKAPGTYNIMFDAGKYNLSSGVYFYKINAGNFTSTKKFILMK